MRLTGKLFSKDEDQETPASSRHYSLCVINVYTSGTDPGKDEAASPKISQSYPKKTLGTVNWLTAGQMLVALLMIGCQVVTFYWQVTVRLQREIQLYRLNIDYAAAGIWTGLIILVTGIVGKCAVNRNARCLIVAQLVLNAFAVLFAIALVVFASISVATFWECKTSGFIVHADDSSYHSGYGHHNDYIRHDYDYAATTTTTTTTTPPPVSFYGELIGRDDDSLQFFYCTHVLFTVWMILEVTMVVSGLVALGLAITLLVKSSNALCLCCRRCCTVDDKEEDTDKVDLLPEQLG